MKLFGSSENKDSFSFELTQPKSKILEKLEKAIKEHKSGWREQFGFVPHYIDYARFKIQDERIVVKSIVKSRPSPIDIYLEDIPGGKTTLRLEQENSVARSKTIVAGFSAIMFVLLFFINISSGDESLGVNLLLTLIPVIFGVLGLAFILYLLEKVQKYALKGFAKQIVRSLDRG